MGQQTAEPAAGAGDHHALAGNVGRIREGRGDLHLIGHRPFPCLYRSVQYTVRGYGPVVAVVVLGADLLEMHRRMLVIRGFEQHVAALYRDGEIPGFVHLSIGQEATAVGACWPLGAADVITSTHRGHGHCLAKGLAPREMFAELMAREAGTNRGAEVRCTSPIRTSASSAPTASSPPGCRSQWERQPRRRSAPTATWWSRSSGTARWPRARSTKP